MLVCLVTNNGTFNTPCVGAVRFATSDEKRFKRASLQQKHAKLPYIVITGLQPQNYCKLVDLTSLAEHSGSTF
jgi:hypothetical protein